MVTSVPLKVAVEKLRGFIADHFAQVKSVEANTITLILEGAGTKFARRNSDRQIPFVVEMEFAEERPRRLRS